MNLFLEDQGYSFWAFQDLDATNGEWDGEKSKEI